MENKIKKVIVEYNKEVEVIEVDVFCIKDGGDSVMCKRICSKDLYESILVDTLSKGEAVKEMSLKDMLHFAAIERAKTVSILLGITYDNNFEIEIKP